MCCAFCHFENLHQDHKLIKLSDIESLSKVNIKIESVTNDFDEMSQKLIDLNYKIKTEINKINNLYENTINHITKSYIRKHEILTKEENELKEKLNNEVNKIKENLEKFLSETNINIKINESINKGIKNIKNEDRNMIKLISYISKINKNKINNKKLFSELMKNIKFKYEQDKINYEEYYFNGIPKSKIIEFKDITTSSLNISWNIDNINNNNENIKYKIEMRKENEEFKKIYEGNNNNYLINNLIKGTNYEFIIYSFYNNLFDSKSEIYKIKTLDIDSNILNGSKRGNEFINKLNEWTGYKKIELIYSGTRDGMTSNVFHYKCDNKGETITLIKNEKGNIFGGYASIPWTTNKSCYSAPESFIFTLSNIYNTEPTKFPSKNDQKEVYHYPGYGPCFGYRCDLGVNYDIIKEGGWSNFPNIYQDILGKGKSIFTGDSNNNNEYFKIEEIEVFKISK